MFSPISFFRHLLLRLVLTLSSTATGLAQGLSADTLTIDTSGQEEDTVLQCVISPAVDSLTLGRRCVDSHAVKWHQQAIPGILAVGGGILVTYTTAREGLRRRLQERGRYHDVRIDDYLQYVPYAANVLVGCAGVKSKHGLGGRALMTATAALLQAGVTNAIKYTVRERRPRSGRYNSFPSGHSATVFAGAELCRIEYGWKVGGPAYAMAATVGFLRMWNDYHWYNDVLAGAAIGVLSAQAANYLYPLERKLFRPLERRIAERRATRRSNRKSEATNARMILVPSYDSMNAAPGLNFVAHF